MTDNRGSHDGDDYEDYDDDDEYVDEDEDGYEDAERGGHRQGGSMSALDAARGAMAHIGELTGRQPAGVTSLRAGDDGWVAEVEVVEDRRIPSSEGILGLYRMGLDDDGTPLGYERLGRYRRGRGDRREEGRA